MRILIINKFLYPRGGDCIVALNTAKALESKGHQVAFFAMDYPENIKTEWNHYFPTEVNFNSKNLINLVKAFSRPFGFGVRVKFLKLLKAFNPDVIHLHNIHSQLSPILAEIAYKRKIKVVWTVHDYKLICPRYDSTREGKECLNCSTDPASVIKYRCVKGSFLGSAIGYGELKHWSINKLSKYTSTFIAPSQFMKDQLVKGGFDSSKITVLFNFTPQEKIDIAVEPIKGVEDAMLYVGRISEEKGIKTLLHVANQMDKELYVIGDGPLLLALQEQYKNCNQIHFLGHQSWESIKQYLLSVKFMVVPSEWNENNPLSIIEALSIGLPVLGANRGGIPELIDINVNGLIFESNNAISLKESICAMYNQNWNKSDIQQKASSVFSEKTHCDNLLKIYNR